MPIPKKIKHELGYKLLQSDFLSEREKDVLKMRLGLDGAEPSTLQEMGIKYSISRERIRQIGVAISRKIKKYFPDEILFANQIFAKSWEPKYKIKERYLVRRRAIIKRNKSIVRNKCVELAELIDRYAVSKEDKELIFGLFKELRIKYRKNKSLFEPDVVIEIKNLRQKWNELRKPKQNPTPEITPPNPIF
jgi:hypothetical protein